MRLFVQLPLSHALATHHACYEAQSEYMKMEYVSEDGTEKVVEERLQRAR